MFLTMFGCVIDTLVLRVTKMFDRSMKYTSVHLLNGFPRKTITIVSPSIHRVMYGDIAF